LTERIAFVSRYNQTCGVSCWAEPVVPYLISQGNEVLVIANRDAKTWLHSQDEPYVKRDLLEFQGKILNTHNFRPDILVIQQHNTFPVQVPKEWQSAKRIMICHYPQGLYAWDDLKDYDLVVGFDERWIPYFDRAGVKRYAIVDYVVRPIRLPDASREELRRKWRLPANLKVVFVYGIRASDYVQLLSVPVLHGYYLLFVSTYWFPYIYFSFRFDFRYTIVSRQQLDELLKAVDVMWLHKPEEREIPVLSSTIYYTADSCVPYAVLGGRSGRGWRYDIHAPPDLSYYEFPLQIPTALANARCDYQRRKAWCAERYPDKIWRQIVQVLP